jgi:hypothetical protein
MLSREMSSVDSDKSWSEACYNQFFQGKDWSKTRVFALSECISKRYKNIVKGKK